jgi:hypothetical protein
MQLRATAAAAAIVLGLITCDPLSVLVPDELCHRKVLPAIDAVVRAVELSSGWSVTPTRRSTPGHSPGQSVVLVDDAEAVPSSNNNMNLGGNLGGGGASAASSVARVASPVAAALSGSRTLVEEVEDVQGRLSGSDGPPHFPDRRTNREMARVIAELTIGLGSVHNRCHRP